MSEIAGELRVKRMPPRDLLLLFLLFLVADYGEEAQLVQFYLSFVSLDKLGLNVKTCNELDRQMKPIILLSSSSRPCVKEMSHACLMKPPQRIERKNRFHKDKLRHLPRFPDFFVTSS